MKKEELVDRHIAEMYLSGAKKQTQLGLSKALGIAISNVNSAVSNLQRTGALRIEKRGFTVTDFKRLMLYWATHRNLEKDIVYSTRADTGVKEIEGSLPGKTAFTAYSAYRLLFGEAPADYGEVYVYATNASLTEIKRRFVEKEGVPNLIVLEPDPILEKSIEDGSLKHSSVAPPQLFADLWNINTWNAREYSEALAKRLFGD